MLAYFVKVLGWWLASIVKFLFTPFVMITNPGSEHWSFIEIILITSSGAALGVFLFYHFGEWILKHWPFGKGKKKIFTPTRRRIISLKNKMGIKGLMLVCGLISVPVSAMLCARYFKHDPTAMAKLILGFCLWSVVLTSLAYAIRIASSI